MTPDYVIDEMQRNGETFRRKKLCRVDDLLRCAGDDAGAVFAVHGNSGLKTTKKLIFHIAI